MCEALNVTEPFEADCPEVYKSWLMGGEFHMMRGHDWPELRYKRDAKWPLDDWAHAYCQVCCVDLSRCPMNGEHAENQLVVPPLLLGDWTTE